MKDGGHTWDDHGGARIRLPERIDLPPGLLPDPQRFRPKGSPPLRIPVRVDATHHHIDRRSSSTMAKYADALRCTSWAWRRSRFSLQRLHRVGKPDGENAFVGASGGETEK